MGLFKVPPPGTKYIKLCAGSCLWYLCNSTKWPQPSILNTPSLRHRYPLLAMCPSLDFSSFMGLFTCISFAKTSPSHFFFLSSQGFTFFFEQLLSVLCSSMVCGRCGDLEISLVLNIGNMSFYVRFIVLLSIFFCLLTLKFLSSINMNIYILLSPWCFTCLVHTSYTWLFMEYRFTNIKIRENFFKNGNYRSFWIYFGNNFVVIQYGNIFTELLECISVRYVWSLWLTIYNQKIH